jgi:polyhydroxyalkanoate synthesis regulator phasin
MKIMNKLILLSICILSMSCSQLPKRFKDGDIIFQTSKSSQSDMLKIVSDAGLIAQEVEEIMPNIVRETKWDCHKTLNYNGVIALLVEGMKEQQTYIQALEARIQKLEEQAQQKL